MKDMSMYMCAFCKGRFDFQNIRYNNDGKTIVCVDCYNLAKKSSKKTNDERVVKDSEKKNAVKVRCIDCGYKFFLKRKSKVKARCPYCGKERLMIDDTTAEKLIEEVSQNKHLWNW